MLVQSINQMSDITAITLTLASWKDVLKQIWSYLIEIHSVGNGNIKFSITTIIEAAVIFGIALLMSRTLSALLQRRIAKRACLDPGIQYTLGRLTQYLVIAIGLLLALTIGIGVNLTSLAVVFTALSVGIGFGLQYIAADLAAGFILLFERPVRVGDRITIGEDEGDVQSIN